jgi:hypothetical protein
MRPNMRSSLKCDRIRAEKAASVRSSKIILSILSILGACALTQRVSLSQETWNAHILHAPKDKLSAMRLDDYYQARRVLAAYLVFLDPSAGVQAASTVQ